MREYRSTPFLRFIYRKVITAPPSLALKVYRCIVLERFRNIEKAPSRDHFQDGAFLLRIRANTSRRNRRWRNWCSSEPCLCLQVNLDAEFVLANLDAARRNTSPLVKQGLASDRDLPGLQSHACKQNYVIISPLNSSIFPINTFCPVSRGNRLYCRKTSKSRYSQ